MKAHLLLLMALPLAIAFAADAPFTLPRETTKLKPGAGVELVTAQCLICHSADYISTQPRLTRAQWRASVVKMQQKYGAPIATNSVERLVDYLTGNYGSDTALKK
jgi:sulfite dehydrogenase (cytochrome) subunit B